jgi:hypothetical protein
MRKEPAGPSSGVLIKAAMDYGRLGWSVVPVEARGIESLVRWQIYQHRQPRMTEIGDWFNRWPSSNLAIVTGVVSMLVALDLSPQRGGEASLKALQQEQTPLPETVEAAVGERRQLYFSHPGGIVRDRIDLAPGIDLRGDGGYLLAPPSVDASGEHYRWVHSPEVFHIESLPAWLLSIQADKSDRPADSAEPWQCLLQAGADEGKRSDAVATLAGHLLSKGVDPKVALELMLCWNATRCHPPLDADKVAHAVERVADMRKNIKITS